MGADQGSQLADGLAGTPPGDAKVSTAYPGTPEEVVEAFVKAALGHVSVTVAEMSLCDEVLEVQSKYFPKEQDIEADSETHVIDLGEPWVSRWANSTSHLALTSRKSRKMKTERQ